MEKANIKILIVVVFIIGFVWLIAYLKLGIDVTQEKMLQQEF